MPQIHFLHRNRRYLNADFAELPFLAFEDYESMTLGVAAILSGWQFGGKVFTYSGSVGLETFETSTLTNNTPPGPDFGWSAIGIVTGFGITSSPVNTYAVSGGTVSFVFVPLQGLLPLTYQWQKSGVNMVDGGVVSGSTTATLTLTGVSGGDFGTSLYRCIATDAQGQTVTSSAASLIDPVADWVARVVINGGATPSGATQTALTTFMTGILSDGTVPLLKSFCFFPPDSLIAAITPVLVGGGNDPWTNHSFVSGDLTGNGLKGNGTSKYLDTGLKPGTIYATDNEGGLGMYIYAHDNNLGAIDMGCDGGAFSTNSFHLYGTFSDGNTYYDNFGAGTGRINAANSKFVGYIAGNRTGASAEAIYVARSNLAHSALVTGTGASNQTRSTTQNVTVFANNSNGSVGTFSGKRLSFAFISDGLSSGQSSSFFSRIQQLRQDLHGGYVLLAGPDIVDDWAARVVANGGASPSGGTVTALKTFIASLDSASITNKMIALNAHVPDSLTACITPLIVGPGLDPWTNTAFVSGDLTVNGLVGNGSSKWLNTGVIAGTSGMSVTSAGLTIYAFDTLSSNSGYAIGSGGASTNSQFAIEPRNAGNTNAYLWKFSGLNSTDGVSIATPGAGYFSSNRVSASDLRLFWANSGHAHAQVGAALSAQTGVIEPTYALAAHAINVTGSATAFCNKRLSFVAAHLGLSSTESSALFSAVQALRTSLGGGFV